MLKAPPAITKILLPKTYDAVMIYTVRNDSIITQTVIILG